MALGRVLLPLPAPQGCGQRPLGSEGRRAVGVSEHGVEGPGEVVGEGAAVVFL